MSKTVLSPVQRWPGSVTLSDPLTFPQYIAWRDNTQAAARYAVEKGENAKQAEYELLVLESVRPVVEKWELGGGFTPNAFPATPRPSCSKLISWLVAEVSAIANEANETDPNSSPPSTPGA